MQTALPFFQLVWSVFVSCCFSCVFVRLLLAPSKFGLLEFPLLSLSVGVGDFDWFERMHSFNHSNVTTQSNTTCAPGDDGDR